MKLTSILTLMLLVGVVFAAPIPKENDDNKLEKLFGKKVDPNKDCEFTFDGKKLTIKAGKGDHSLHVLQQRMQAPRIHREIEGDFVAEVKVSAEYPMGAKSVVPNRSHRFHSLGLLVWIDEKNYVRFEKAHMVTTEISCYASFEYFRDGQWTRSGKPADGLFESADTPRLRITRKGNTLTPATSTDDGKTWKELEKLETKLPAKIQVGVVANHNTDTEFAATFDEYSVKPAK
jgi:regulation of enolase protein 1 (concanavalin A-like superfamily)